MSDFLELCNRRFAARKFTSQPISSEDMAYIKEAVRLAPSAANRQAWKFLLVCSDEAKAKLRECYPGEWFKTAPMYVIAMKNASACWVRKEDGKLHDDIDIGIATEHLCLAATERGLGTCWVCHYDTEKVQRYFPVTDFEAAAIVPIGHLAPDCPVKEKERKAIEEIFSEV